ncbi:uncharacterized protein MYCFIDRAFT_173213 [Pseudocercospora fijiensis CIRAD86]|uniref:Uncharacterized protein n=1 Tax=Pseudocercospora fijiensis (strain CIRAD86) TaxID=383855 RepID=M2ZZ18_PSEFD|nr:uncharacterized protein MYCFIDRAFT_173213 [Pseudocercospora fijiensis CIRAD86]EME84174.1 hypothetical protein MYCFIDRAFT_173213 [Pseudocercospora fijiensis CIRAD86]
MSDMYQHDAFLSREQLDVAETKYEEASLELVNERTEMIVSNAEALELALATAQRRHDELADMNEELVRENHDPRDELGVLKRYRGVPKGVIRMTDRRLIGLGASFLILESNRY